jgi:Beta-lactamase enzyme family
MATSTPPAPRRGSTYVSHGRRQRRPHAVVVVLTAVVALFAVVVAVHVLVPGQRPTASSTAVTAGGRARVGDSVMQARQLPFRPTPVTFDGDEFLSWAVMDQRTGEIWGSPSMAVTNWTASMIKAWLGADYLRRATEQHRAPSDSILSTIEIMIRDSDNDAATRIYTLNGGTPSILRMITMCGLTDSSATPGRWGTTSISARDAVRMGTCIASGKGAGPQWTDWLLDTMRHVRGESDFGIRDALPPDEAATVAVKNGYEHFPDDNKFRVNCLAIGDGWTMAVLQTYSPRHGWTADLAHGADGCRQVASQLLVQPRTTG